MVAETVTYRFQSCWIYEVMILFYDVLQNFLRKFYKGMVLFITEQTLKSLLA